MAYTGKCLLISLLTIFYRVSLELYRVESLHPPGYSMTVSVLRDIIKKAPV